MTIVLRNCHRLLSLNITSTPTTVFHPLVLLQLMLYLMTPKSKECVTLLHLQKPQFQDVLVIYFIISDDQTDIVERMHGSSWDVAFKVKRVKTRAKFIWPVTNQPSEGSAVNRTVSIERCGHLNCIYFANHPWNCTICVSLHCVALWLCSSSTAQDINIRNQRFVDQPQSVIQL